jgi:hypothetical protein
MMEEKALVTRLRLRLLRLLYKIRMAGSIRLKVPSGQRRTSLQKALWMHGRSMSVDNLPASS